MERSTNIADNSTSASELQRRAHELIPGGGHTYAKGDDQYPEEAPPFLVRGSGCRVWDTDGKEYIEYGMGLRAVSLGHGYRSVVDAAYRAMSDGLNFTRPSPIEVECAEELLGLIQGAEMVKFAKNGSDVTTAAVKLARAWTGRDLIAICRSQPFLSVDDWFIGTTAMNSGIPAAIRDLTVGFDYNDLDGVERLFAKHEGRISALILEPATYIEPAPGFLEGLRRLCDASGTLLIFDEMITGFRWHLGGAQAVYGVAPDLATFGKAMSNGFPLAALVGTRDIMELGGLRHDRQRVFLLSTTNGAETSGLAAGMETMRIYRRESVIDALYRQGERLRAGIARAAEDTGVSEHFSVLGRPCNLIYSTRDADGRPSQAYRTLFMQETIRRGVIAPSLVISYSHTDQDVDQTVDAIWESLRVYRRALDEGVQHHLRGRSVKPVFRQFV